MKKLAIRFGDNDFGNTFLNLLKTIANADEHVKEMISDKELLCKMINEISYGHYLLFQNQFNYNEEKSGELCERTKLYLQITPDRLLIDKEVDIYVKDRDWDNSETFILDLSGHEPYIYSL